MAKGNDKKVVRQALELLLATIGNLLESHRERRFPGHSKKRRSSPLPRKLFCEKTGLDQSTVGYIETGRFLKLDRARLREYLAATYGKSDANFATSTKKVYDGLKELGHLLKQL